MAYGQKSLRNVSDLSLSIEASSCLFVRLRLLLLARITSSFVLLDESGKAPGILGVSASAIIRKNKSAKTFLDAALAACAL